MSARIGFSGTPVISETRYNNRGQVSEVEKPYLYGNRPQPSILTTFSYDVLGRQTKVLAPGETNGTVTEYLGPGTSSMWPPVFDQSGVTVTNDKGQTATEYYDARGLLVGAVDANGVPTHLKGAKTLSRGLFLARTI